MARKQQKQTSDKPTDIIGRLIQGVSKKYSPDVISTLSNATIYSQVKQYISTQCYGLDFALHLPGLPTGRIITIRGDYASGKTTIAIHLLAETQRLGGIAVYIDTEYSFDQKRAQAIGVDVDKLIIVQPETVDEAIGVIEQLISDVREEAKSGFEKPVCIVWDSVAGTPTKEDLEGEFGENQQPGRHARALSIALRRMAQRIAQFKIMLVFVNQEKDRLDFWSMGKNLKTTVAERPLNFHSSVILNPRKIKVLTDSRKNPYGIRVRCEVSKNKSAAPFSKAEFTIRFDTGMDNIDSMLSIAHAEKLVTKNRGWYTFKPDHGDETRFQAKDFPKILDTYPELVDRLDQLKMDYALKTWAPNSDEDDEEDIDEDEDDE